MKKVSLIYITIVFSLMFLSCNRNVTITMPLTNNATVNTTDNQGTISEEDKNTITFLGNDESMITFFVGPFEEAHPGIKIKFVKKEFSNTEIIMDNLASGGGADIINLERDQMGQFNCLDGFEDLLQPPYNTSKMLNKFADHQLSWTMSLDGKKLLALPFTHSPRVTYYREDILRQYGFPSEPEELAKFMENPDNWLNMARELKKHDKWIISWRIDPIDIYGKQMGFFDKNLNYTRNNEGYIKMLSAIRAIKAENLASFMGVWEPSGQQAIKDNRMAMVYMGCWGETILQSWVPEQRGKWRVTRLPFGVYGLDGSPALAISKNSKHKELAWEFVQMVAKGYNDYINNMKNNRNNFLGGQQTQKFYADLRKKIPQTYCTPLDKNLDDLWVAETQTYYEYSYKDKGDAQALRDIEEKVKAMYGKEIEILKKSLKK